MKNARRNGVRVIGTGPIGRELALPAAQPDDQVVAPAAVTVLEEPTAEAKAQIARLRGITGRPLTTSGPEAGQ